MWAKGAAARSHRRIWEPQNHQYVGQQARPLFPAVEIPTSAAVDLNLPGSTNQQCLNAICQP